MRAGAQSGKSDRVRAATVLIDQVLAEHDEQTKQVANVAEAAGEVCGSSG